MFSTASGPERAKYQAWRSKSGLSQEESMRLYLQESDRQIRVYGSAANPQTPTLTNNVSEASVKFLFINVSRSSKVLAIGL